MGGAPTAKVRVSYTLSGFWGAWDRVSLGENLPPLKLVPTPYINYRPCLHAVPSYTGFGVLSHSLPKTIYQKRD